ncbi:MAG: ribbon-helix-helix protein, CopG family [Solirubrobacterales bacterium]
MSDVKTMSLRLPAEQAKELEAVAAVDNMPVSEVVRDAIDALIETRRKDKAFKARLRRSIKENNDILERLAR